MERIAIIGIGCRFPGGVDDAASFWRVLREERNCITEIPADRWSLEGFFDARPDLPNRSYSKWGGFLDDIRGFDPPAFSLSPREAEAMDPQQRLLLMAARDAACDARLPLAEMRRQNAGVFVGVSNIDYGLMQRYRTGQGESFAGTGTALSIVANRVSNRLDLPGPSMGVDTACSSSLVAVDTACRHLVDGSCDIAFAGGVNVLLDPRMFITFSRAHMLSPMGRIRAFDAAADGFVRGEGVGVVVLRRLETALDAGDKIYAVIDATAVNQDGRTGAITEPNLNAQIAMMRSAARRAGLAPASLDYVEAHGTGTFVGDPIEANAIGTVFGKPGSGPPPYVGSVKTNIGHLEPAAGIAGLIKASLVLHHRKVPASLGYEKANPAIDFDALGIAVAGRPVELREKGPPLRALVNSFGFGGTNACALLSSADGGNTDRRITISNARPRREDATPWPVAVPLSGPTEQHLQRFAARLSEAIDGGSLAGQSVADIAGAIAAQRDHGEYRAAIVATTPEELRERLVCLSEGRPWPAADRHAPPEIVTGKARRERTLVFTMTGQGGQWWSMGRELYEHEPVFRQSIEAFDRVFKNIGGWSVVEELLADEEISKIHDAAITPAVMFAFQTGLAEVWRARGVSPDIVLGHSFGEVTAAYLAEGIGKEAVAGLVTHRGLIRGHVERAGAMAAIGLGAEAIEPLLPTDGSIEIGGYNSPQMVTLTGEENSIDALIKQLNDEDPTVLTRKLALDFAYHSSWFTPVEEIFKADVGELATASPNIRVISTVTGDLNNRFDADYWWQNLRYPVRYQQAVERALELGGDTFLELGPHRTLSSMTAACAAAKGASVTTVSTLDKRWGDLVSVATATGQLYIAGVDIDWQAIHGGQGREVALPHPPWILQDLWSEPEEASRAMRPDGGHPLLGRRESGPAPMWSSEISLATHAYLGDHRLDGVCVFPGAAYVEMLASAAREILGCEAVELVDVAFPAGLHIGGDDVVQLKTTYDAVRRKVAISSRLRDGADDWQLRTEAKIYPLQSSGRTGTAGSLQQGANIEPREFYGNAEANGFGWGWQFQGLKFILAGNGTAQGRIDTAERPGEVSPSFLLDPRAVDSAMQLMLACDEHRGANGLMPVGIARVRVYGALASESVAVAGLRKAGQGAVADVTISSIGGEDVVSFEGIETRSRRKSEGAGNRARGQLYRETFEPIVVKAPDQPPDGVWLILAAEGCDRSARFADALNARGGQVEIYTVEAGSAKNRHVYCQAFRDCFSRAPLAGIIYALPLAPADWEESNIAAAATAECVRATAFAQAMAELSGDEPLPPIIVLTQNARVSGGEDVIGDDGLARSVLPGLFRTLQMEAPELSLQFIDIDEKEASVPRILLDVLWARTKDSELAVRGGRVLAARFGEVADQDLQPASVPLSRLSSSINFRLGHRGAPGADGLRWRQARAAPLGPDDVEVEVRAVGLNFRDVMAVSGMLPEDAEPTPAIEKLGLELSGVAIRYGENVQGLKTGDRVFGMGRGALQRRVTFPSATLLRVPRGISHAEAATVPSAFLTAHFALNTIGRVESGETVLVHSATGGVGLAAIALCRRAGANIIATAGNDEKREYLKRIGIKHVFDSRNLGFADDVMCASGGRGVDVVLNSLGGAFIDKSLSCLAPHGRFLELGKRDVYFDSALGLRGLRSNASFHVIDLAALIAERPRVAGTVFKEVVELLKAGEISPLPFTQFGASQAAGAFRLMAEARHTGKVVIGMDDPEVQIEKALAEGATLDPEGTYLVTGGVEGFGRAVGEWLARCGAGRVVLASRSAETGMPGCEGPVIETLRLDVTDEAAVNGSVASLTSCGKPLRGIVHAAVVYDDALVANMGEERIGRVLAPKISGGINLTRAVEKAGSELDFFVSFSSLAQVVGWAGQSNYAAANSFLDALAHWQCARNIPGLCINWGALDESGHVARSDKMQSFLASAGWIGIDNDKALGILARCLDADQPVLAVPSVDWKRLAETHPGVARSPRTGCLASADRGGADATSRGLRGLFGDELLQAVSRIVRDEAAKVLRVGAETILSAETLNEAGIDSLSAFELRLRMEQQLRLEVPLARYARASRFDDLSALACSLVEEARTRERQ